uniref:Uncharacterized protein n=1 Tax=Aegilops tauschii subsp. strangulata TaxID=200361 RepID=A0A453KNK3_AEGTS
RLPPSAISRVFSSPNPQTLEPPSNPRLRHRHRIDGHPWLSSRRGATRCRRRHKQAPPRRLRRHRYATPVSPHILSRFVDLVFEAAGFVLGLRPGVPASVLLDSGAVPRRLVDTHTGPLS